MNPGGTPNNMLPSHSVSSSDSSQQPGGGTPDHTSIASSSVQPSNLPPLHHEVANSNIEQVKFLLESGADPNELDGEHRCCLYHANGDDPAITLLLLRNSARMCEMMDWKAKARILDLAFRTLHPDADEAVLLGLLASCMDGLNERSIERQTVSTLMGVLTLRFCWILGYVLLVFDVFSTDEKMALFVLSYMYIFSAFFSVQLLFKFPRLFEEGAEPGWYIVDVMTILLVLISTTTCILTGVPELGSEGEGPTQRLCIVTILFLTIMFLGSLKHAFLPFSVFVGGVTQILYDLIPFLVVTVTILLVFSTMYYMQGGLVVDSTFQDAFFFVFSGFAGGLENVESYLDVIFGVMLVIILFNVVIAIVSSSWQTAVNRSFINLCKDRLEIIFAADMQKCIDDQISAVCCDLHFSAWLAQDFWVDRFDSSLIAWARNMRGATKERKSAKRIIYTGIVFTVEALWLTSVGVLGIPLLGVAWPTRIRSALFRIDRGQETLGMKVDRIASAATEICSDITSLHAKIDTIEAKMTTVPSDIAGMEGRVGRLETKLEDLSAKLDIALDYLISNRGGAAFISPRPDDPLPPSRPSTRVGGGSSPKMSRRGKDSNR